MTQNLLLGCWSIGILSVFVILHKFYLHRKKYQPAMEDEIQYFANLRSSYLQQNPIPRYQRSVGPASQRVYGPGPYWC